MIQRWVTREGTAAGWAQRESAHPARHGCTWPLPGAEKRGLLGEVIKEQGKEGLHVTEVLKRKDAIVEFDADRRFVHTIGITVLYAQHEIVLRHGELVSRHHESHIFVKDGHRFRGRKGTDTRGVAPSPHPAPGPAACARRPPTRYSRRGFSRAPSLDGGDALVDAVVDGITELPHDLCAGTLPPGRQGMLELSVRVGLGEPEAGDVGTERDALVDGR